MFTKQMDCLDCGFKGKAAHELTYCPYCLSSNILTMSHRQVRQQRKRNKDTMYKLVNAFMREEEAIQDAFSQLNRL